MQLPQEKVLKERTMISSKRVFCVHFAVILKRSRH